MNQVYVNAMASATTMRGLVPTAMAMLREISNNGQIPVSQVCGPISTGGLGSLDKNLAVFKLTIRLLQEKGEVIFDQTVFQDAITRITKHHPNNAEYRTEILKDFFRDIFSSGFVKKGVFIPGWRSSVGSRWEHGLLCTLHITREELSRKWYNGAL